MLWSKLELDVPHFDVCILLCWNPITKIVCITVYTTLFWLVFIYIKLHVSAVPRSSSGQSKCIECKLNCNCIKVYLMNEISTLHNNIQRYIENKVHIKTGCRLKVEGRIPITNQNNQRCVAGYTNNFNP